MREKVFNQFCENELTVFFFLSFQANPSVPSGSSGDKYTPLGALASLQPGSAQAAAASAQLAAQQAAVSTQRAAAAYQGAPHHFQQAGKTNKQAYPKLGHRVCSLSNIPAINGRSIVYHQLLMLSNVHLLPLN